MSDPYVWQTLTSQKAAGTAFNTFTTAKSVINVTELVSIQPNWMQVGRRFRVYALLGISNTSTAVTFNCNVQFGTVAALASGAIQLATTANTNLPVVVNSEFRIDVAGSGTTAKAIGIMTICGLAPQLGAGVANPTVSDSIVVGPSGTPADGTGFDSTVTQTLDFWVGFGTSAAGNQVQVWDYYVATLAGSAV